MSGTAVGETGTAVGETEYCTHRSNPGLPNVGVYQSNGLLLYRFLILATRVHTRTLTLVV